MNGITQSTFEAGTKQAFKMAISMHALAEALNLARRVLCYLKTTQIMLGGIFHI